MVYLIVKQQLAHKYIRNHLNPELYVCTYVCTEHHVPKIIWDHSFPVTSQTALLYPSLQIHLSCKDPDHPSITSISDSSTVIVGLVPGCNFTSETTKGLKIHLRKSHKWPKDSGHLYILHQVYSAMVM